MLAAEDVALTEEQIQRLVDKIAEIDKSVAVQLATFDGKLNALRDDAASNRERVALLWDWKNQTKGSFRAIKWLQAGLLAVVGVFEAWRAIHP